MDLAVTAEHEALASSVRRFCTDRFAPSEVRRLMDTREGWEPGTWKQLITDLGVAGLQVPEEFGGPGGDFTDLACVFAEFGRSLACVPYLSTFGLAANAILNAAPSRELLEPLVTGERTAALAWSPQGRFVVDGQTAGLLLFIADDALHAVTEGFTHEPLDTLDLTRKLADVRIDGVNAERIGPLDVEKTRDHASVCIAAEAVGGARACLEMAVSYASDRVQFGRPIGAFQAVKHHCAEMLLKVESAASAASYAAWAASEDNAELPLAASLAKAYATDAFYDCARTNIQVHGGIGFTWEHDAHLYYRRAKTLQLLGGSPGEHRTRIAEKLGI